MDEQYYKKNDEVHAVLNVRVDKLEKIADETREAIMSIATSIAKLATIEEKIDERHEENKAAFERAFDKIVKIEERMEIKCQEKEEQLKRVEIELAQWLILKPYLAEAQKEHPFTIKVRDWVVRAAIGIVVVVGFAVLHLVTSPQARADVDYKYCGQPQRDANGVIVRSAKVKAAFRAEVPCPVTGLTFGACPGWSIDHVWPLDSCGCDSVSNMQWLKNSIKSCAGTECKDRWERNVYKCKE